MLWFCSSLEDDSITCDIASLLMAVINGPVWLTGSWSQVHVSSLGNSNHSEIVPSPVWAHWGDGKFYYPYNFYQFCKHWLKFIILNACKF